MREREVKRDRRGEEGKKERRKRERTRAPEFWVETLFLSLRVYKEVGFLSFSYLS